MIPTCIPEEQRTSAKHQLYHLRSGTIACIIIQAEPWRATQHHHILPLFLQKLRG